MISHLSFILSLCPSGEIGKRTRFRCVRGNLWRFKSSLGHHLNENAAVAKLVNAPALEAGEVTLESSSLSRGTIQKIFFKCRSSAFEKKKISQKIFVSKPKKAFFKKKGFLFFRGKKRLIFLRFVRLPFFS